MEITYIGHSCFKIKGKNASLVIDPYNPKSTGYKMPKQSADTVLLSHHHDDHNFIESVIDYKLLIETPGEYEFSDIFVYGIKTFHDDKKGEERGLNTIYQIEIDDFTLLHLGDLGHELSQDTLEQITDTDVLFIPVGGVYTINAQVATKVISSIEPSIIIPMHYQTKDLKLPSELDELDKFLEEMGVQKSNVKEEPKLRLNYKTDLPEEGAIYILDPQH